MPVDLVALTHAQSRQVTVQETVYTCNPHTEIYLMYFMGMSMVTCSCISKPPPLTVHFVALDEIFVLLQATSRIRDVRPDVLIQVPAEVLIVHHEQQSILVVS